MLRRAAQKILKAFGLYGLYSLKVKGPLLEDGWFRSFDEQRPLDLRGHPLPYITYPAMEFLSRRIGPGMTVFEYGCGASTLWWSARVKQVDSAEHSREWYEHISSQAPSNVKIHYAPISGTTEGDSNAKEAYARLALEPGRKFSIIVIDGRLRVRCVRHAVHALTPDGVIVWDNSDRVYYEPGYRLLAEHGFKRLEFVGIPPGVNEKTETSVFYRAGNCLGI